MRKRAGALLLAALIGLSGSAAAGTDRRGREYREAMIVTKNPDSVVYVREGPGKNTAWHGSLPCWSHICVYETRDGWVHMSREGWANSTAWEIQGWVSEQYVEYLDK